MGEPIFVRVDCEAFDYVPVRLSSYDVFCLQLVTCVPQRHATDFLYTNHTSSCCQVQTNADFACNVRIPVKSSTESGLCRPPIPVFTVHKKSSAALATSLYTTGRHAYSRARFPLRFTDQIEAVSVMDQAIQDGIRQGWIREARVILSHGHLGRDQGG